ncbi:methyltransferase domain-containing protein [Halocalculus aciditolerans]|uniref:methyltransferase domain-containing protein n=1 Tax=Halocalculus aciditolerans TaxID=1383812 RepID=UPI001E4C8412|nr:methyltransferase domain-containing protein [Halocalculus aciditolerans]
MYLLEFAGEDDGFAAAEAGVAAGGVDRFSAGLATATVLDAGRVATLAYTHFASELLGRTDADLGSARVLLEASSVERAGSVAVRARDVRGATGVDTQRVERELGSVLVDRGFSVDLDDPDHELRAVFSERADGDGVCALGWLEAASVRDYGDRKPTDRPFFQPGSMAPLDARALVNLARVDPGDRLLDPMCGTGGVLLEAGIVGAKPIGNDAQAKMVRGTRKNLSELSDSAFDVLRGDATRLALRDDSVDGVVFDAPYGRQSKIETHGLKDLVAGALAEARRVSTGRCVLVADRDWRAEAREAGWTVKNRFERRVHRSLVRHVLVLG